MDSKKGAAIGIGIAAVIAVAVAAGMMGSAPVDEIDDQIVPADEGVPEEPAVEEPAVEGDAGLSGDVTIGLILPLTGDLAHKGHENWEGSKFGLQQFNKYLEERGEEDSATNPVVALEKLTSLKAKGIDIVVGPETSSNIRNIKGYADSNNMLLFSCCSTAPALSIAGDSVYRLVPNDTFQGTAIAKKIQHDGAQVLVPMWRGDAWGDG
ncbi:MAG: penicillin-binding protein activator, partial [Nitrosopumilaceae archaeon]|nr:penicillin-binding protein activator [Nitrosopumilaceae archaeon]